ncbi:transcription factor Opi1-domain-containing protein [Phycomyces nitens]|nr:transcription factor Opi1-domain-containing protein [Phycomyces nitens]
MLTPPTADNRSRPHSHSRSTSPIRAAPYHTMKKPHHAVINSSQSKWQQLVVGASSAAGTTAAVVSEESMKCLKYCLSWLQYAVQHIEQQMTLLRNFLVSLATAQSSSTSLSAPGNKSNTPALSSIKKDIVETLRKVVDVISRYAGTSLPQHAKVAVRGFILNLPGRWATLNDIHSTATSPASSPMLGPRIHDGCDMNGLPRVGNKRQEETAIRLLTFGQESVDMLQSISSVFSETVERAELWLDRLRLVRVPGISAAEQDDKRTENDLDSVRLPPIRTLDPPQYSFDRTEKMDLDH